jgi:hypothetical protein
VEAGAAAGFSASSIQGPDAGESQMNVGQLYTKFPRTGLIVVFWKFWFSIFVLTKIGRIPVQ